MTTIALDIETIPSQHEAVRSDFQKQIDDAVLGLEPPASYTKQKQLEWLEKKHAELNVPLDQYEPYRKLALDGCFNHIISIGICVNGEKKHFTIQDGDAIEGEKKILSDFFSYFDQLVRENNTYFQFVGHNIIGFDFKIMKQRGMILGLKPPAKIPMDSKPWGGNPFDTMTQWDDRNFVSMDKLAKAFGLAGKGDVDGSKVYDMFLDGRFQEIGEYCADDARQAYEIYQRMTFKKPKQENV